MDNFNNIFFDSEEIQIDNPEDSSENTSEELSTDVSTEVSTEATTALPAAIVIEPYEYDNSDVQFLAHYNEETSEYESVVVDNRPYMSAEVVGADLDDIFTYVLSIRNIILLWFLLWFILKLKTMIHNVNMKYMEGRK